MLLLLSIENVAIIEKAEIEFGAGFNVLTGETGAGKSIIIDSLEAALGWRTSGQIVRTGAKNATVSAVFSSEGVENWCREHDIEIEDGELILTRKINDMGKSTCRVNGVPVPASVVRQLGLRLIDIHGQGDGQRLTDERFHREYLDAFGDLGALLSEYKAAYSAFKDKQEELERLSIDESEKVRRMDMLRYQIEELEGARLTVGEYDEKMERRELVKNSEKLTSAVNEALAAISGGERSDDALSLIESAYDSVTRAVRYSDRLSGVSEKLSELKYACEDVAYELRDLCDELEFSPDELDEIESRLDVLKRMFRKYGGDEESALSFLESAKEELSDIEYSDERRARLESELDKAKRETERLAEKLSEKRREAGKRLSQMIEAELSALSMKGARFEVGITPEASLGPYGRDDVKFMISANAGQNLGRMSKIASGGELSRIMLAIKSVLSAKDAVQAMVFDEIDTGVSGIAAQRVAEKLWKLSDGKQVICVTHLPQIAAMADTHFSISKSSDDGYTYAAVTRLDRKGRKDELARLTGGDVVTETSLKSAEEQLGAAEKFKTSGKL